MITHRQLDEAQLLPSLFKSLKLKKEVKYIDQIFAVGLEYLRERTCKCRMCCILQWPSVTPGQLSLVTLAQHAGVKFLSKQVLQLAALNYEKFDAANTSL